MEPYALRLQQALTYIEVRAASTGEGNVQYAQMAGVSPSVSILAAGGGPMKGRLSVASSWNGIAIYDIIQYSLSRGVGKRRFVIVLCVAHLRLIKTFPFAHRCSLYFQVLTVLYLYGNGYVFLLGAFSHTLKRAQFVTPITIYFTDLLSNGRTHNSGKSIVVELS